MLTREEYLLYCKKFKKAWQYLCSLSADKDEVIHEICSQRGYSYERMQPILKNAEFIYLDSLPEKLNKQDGDLALFDDNGNFILLDRFIFPVKDMLGNVIALIGWYPDEKKYITTPSKYFSKACLFYGMEQIGEKGLGGTLYLTEGIFDSLSLRSLGFKSLAMMGISGSRYKESLYSLFSRVVAIPDNDPQGRKVLKNDLWNLPSNGKYFRWSGNYKIKDVDDLIRTFEEDDLFDVFSSVVREQDRIVTLEM